MRTGTRVRHAPVPGAEHLEQPEGKVVVAPKDVQNRIPDDLIPVRWDGDETGCQLVAPDQLVYAESGDSIL